jgi:hypothetical protein
MMLLLKYWLCVLLQNEQLETESNRNYFLRVLPAL